MQHRVTKLEFVVKPTFLLIRAMGRTGRGTKFHIRSINIPTEGLSPKEISRARQLAIEDLLAKPATVGS